MKPQLTPALQADLPRGSAALGREWEILELLCRGLSNPERLDRARSSLASPDLDWGELIHQAVRHQMLPLLAYHVLDEEKMSGALAVNVFDHLAQALDFNRHRIAIYRREAARIVRALDDRSVTVVGTKGISLESTVHGGTGVRLMKDIDFMIAPDSREEVSRVMAGLGYQPGVFNARRGRIEPHPRRDHIRYLVHPDHLPRFARLTDDACVRHIYVDFANSLTWSKSPYEIPVELGLRGAQRQPIPGIDDVSLPCFAPTFQFIFTVLHLFREAWLEHWMEYALDVSLMKFADVIRIFDSHREVLCADEFRELLESHGIVEPIAWVLEHLDRTFGTEITQALGLQGRVQESWLQAAHSGRDGERRWRGTMRERLQAKRRENLFADADADAACAGSAANPEALARSISDEVLRASARAVDAENRFPQESVQALREAGLFGYFVPAAHGGLGGDIGGYCRIAAALAENCLSTAIIWAMHCQQVAVLSEHGDAAHREHLERIAREGTLLAGVVSEYGKGGDVLRAHSPLVQNDDRLRISRRAPIVSYGAEAGLFLLTMRAAPDRPDTDVRLVLVAAGDGEIEVTGGWDAMGLRGSRSVPMRFDIVVDASRALSCPFREVAVKTFVPVAHAGWAAAWVGAARGAFAAFVRSLRRSHSPKLRSEAFLRRLAELRARLDCAEAMLTDTAHRLDQLRAANAPVERYEDIAFLVAINNLKIVGSREAFSVVDGLVELAGAARGYTREGNAELERVFRDLRSASLMYSNDRLLDVNGRLILVETSPLAGAWRKAENTNQ